MATVRFTIDGQAVSCEKDSILLDVAQANGFSIPALCYHQAEPAYGACRLCLVEVTHGGRTRVEASCTYPVREDGIEVRTDSERLRRYRRLNLELLLARCPESDVVRRMAQEAGLEQVRLPQDGKDTCILCGLCVRICADVVGVGALGFVGRGPARRVDTPYGEPSDVCIGCGACAEVCPTGHIRVVDDPERMTRRIEPFHTEHKLLKCPKCGRGYVTERQLERLRQQLGERAAVLEGCPVCRSKLRAAKFVAVYQKTAKST